MSFFSELKRRNVFRVGIAYLAAVWALIEVTDTIVSIVGAPAWIPQVLVYSAALGFPVAVVLAWIYELTPQGIRPTGHSETLAPSRFLNRKVDYGIIGLLVLVVGFLVVENYVLVEPANTLLRAGQAPSIAVLPFKNVSSDPEQDYFSDGISEDLIILLAKVPDFRVIARSASFAYRDESVDIPMIADDLNVSHVLEGSVRKAGDAVRISVQLVDAGAQTVWAETYDQTLNDIFAVQDEIAASVLEQLQVTLLGAAPKANEIDLDAYNLFLRAKGILDAENTRETFALAEGFLRQALEIEPGFARAIVELARLRHQVAASRWRARQDVPEGVTRTEFMIEAAVNDARGLLNEALFVDSEHAVAFSWFAFLEWRYGGNFEIIARYVKRALELDLTDPEVIFGALRPLEVMGFADEAILLGEYALSRDPTCVDCYHAVGELYGRAMRFDDAKRSLRTADAINPNNSQPELMAAVLLIEDDAEAALEAYRLAEGAEPEDRAMGIALSLYELGRMEDFELAFTELRDAYGNESPLAVATVYAYTNEADAAFEWLGRMFDGEYHPQRFSIVRNPWFRNLHADPRWDAVLERLGVSPAQLEKLEFQLTLPDYIRRS